MKKSYLDGASRAESLRKVRWTETLDLSNQKNDNDGGDEGAGCPK